MQQANSRHHILAALADSKVTVALFQRSDMGPGSCELPRKSVQVERDPHGFGSGRLPISPKKHRSAKDTRSIDGRTQSEENVQYTCCVNANGAWI